MHYDKFRELVLSCEMLNTNSLMDETGILRRFREFRKSTTLSIASAGAAVGVRVPQFRNQESGQSRLALAQFLGCTYMYSRPGAYDVNLLALIFAGVDDAGYDDWKMSGLKQSPSIALSRASDIAAYYQLGANIGPRLTELRGDCGPTAMALATRLSTGTIRKVESGACEPSLIVALKYIMAKTTTLDNAMLKTKQLFGVKS